MGVDQIPVFQRNSFPGTQTPYDISAEIDPQMGDNWWWPV